MQHMMTQALVCEVLGCQSNDLQLTLVSAMLWTMELKTLAARAALDVRAYVALPYLVLSPEGSKLHMYYAAELIHHRCRPSIVLCVLQLG